MKRLLAISAALLLLAAASIVLAQAPGQGFLKTPSGDHPIGWVIQSGQTFVSASDVVAGLGGTLEADSGGFKVTLGSSVAAFGPDSRFGVIRDDLIEMPVPPMLVDGKPYVPWQFFQGLLLRTSSLEAVWDSAAHTLTVRPPQREAVSAQVSVANVQGITKLVMTLSAPVEYAIVRQPGSYVVRFKSPVRPPFAEQSYEDPTVTKVTFTGDEMKIFLAAPDIAGDAYQLDNPSRIVLDLRKAAGAVSTPAPVVPSQTAPHPPGIRTIVIDPGHGGKEVGAIGPAGLMEKDLTLQLCRRLAASLGAKTGARVILTRDDDSLVSLDQRTAIANQYQADLFLSVHLNAAVRSEAKGSETYFLSLEASDEIARSAAEIENASAATNADADLKLILWDLAQQAYLDESSRFAQAIQEALNAKTGVQNRGVKQAPFKVLIGATMPAALVEVGFISNPDEEAKLKTEAFQSLLVDAITSAVVRYKGDYEVRTGVVPPPAAAAPTAPPAATTTAAANTQKTGAQ
jgi:N-acetylmuramoyl-L-alanine amidase